MQDFGHLRRLAVPETAQADYTFYAIKGEPTLTVRSARYGNKPFLNAVLQRGQRLLHRMKGGKMTADSLAESRAQDLELFPLHIVVGWKNVLNSEGKPAEFSVENCEAFLRALPEDLFDELRAFCNSPENFRPDDQPSLEDLKGN